MAGDETTDNQGAQENGEVTDDKEPRTYQTATFKPELLWDQVIPEAGGKRLRDLTRDELMMLKRDQTIKPLVDQLRRLSAADLADVLRRVGKKRVSEALATLETLDKPQPSR